jgi:hypothetical protein
MHAVQQTTVRNFCFQLAKMHGVTPAYPVFLSVFILICGHLSTVTPCSSPRSRTLFNVLFSNKINQKCRKVKQKTGVISELILSVPTTIICFDHEFSCSGLTRHDNPAVHT